MTKENNNAGKEKGLKIGIIIAVLVAVIVAAGFIFARGDAGSGAEVKKENTTVQTDAAKEENSESVEVEEEKLRPVKVMSDEELKGVTYSSEIGMINGTLYAVMDIGTAIDEYGYYSAKASDSVINGLPVESEENIGAFACYGDYIYYTTCSANVERPSYSLYKCNMDFTDSQLILKNEYMAESEVQRIGMRFIIDNGKLYSGETDLSVVKKPYEYVDLETGEISEFTPHDFNAMFGAEEGEIVTIYDGEVFISNGEWNQNGSVFGYKLVNGEREKMEDESITKEFCGKNINGYANGCIYFSEMFNTPVDGANAKLKCYNVSTGDVQVLDRRLCGGGAYYFQEYYEAENY